MKYLNEQELQFLNELTDKCFNIRTYNLSLEKEIEYLQLHIINTREYLDKSKKELYAIEEIIDKYEEVE